MNLQEVANILLPKCSNNKVNLQANENIISFSFGENKAEYKLVEDNIIPNIDYHLSSHMMRIINKKGFDFFESIADKIIDPYSNCTVCCCTLPYCPKKVSVCNKEKCKLIEESLLIDNTVTNAYKQDKDTFRLLLETSVKAAKGKRRNLCFAPYPYYFSNKNKKYFRDTTLKDSSTEFQDFDKLDKIGEIDPTIFESCMDDADLFKIIGKDKYAFIKFIIASNRANVYAVGKDLYEFKYHPSIESNFDYNNSIFLYHGSAIESWHPIMRNGIKNLSNTKLMVHGAVHGPGVYLAKSANTARSYTGGSPYIGVCLVKNHDKYKKTHDFYVVPENNDLILKFIFKASSINSAKSFIEKRHTELRKVDIDMMKIISKRINKEYNSLEKYNIIKVNESRWKVKLNLKKTMEIDIIFPNAYPEVPPVFSVTNPRFVEGPHIIMDNGVILLPELLLTNWDPKTKIKKILKEIIKQLEKADRYSYVGNVCIENDELINTYYTLSMSYR